MADDAQALSIDYQVYVDAPGESRREVLRMAAPALISMGSVTAMQFVSMWIVGHASKANMAAVTPAALLAYTVIALVEGFATVNNTFVSQNFGARRFAEIARYTWHGIYLAIVVGLLIQFLRPVFPIVLSHLPHAEDVQARELDYIQIRLWGAAFVGMSVALGGFCQGTSRPWISMVTAIIANGINAGLTALLVHGHWGLPKMDVRGAALAQVIAGATEAVMLLGVFLSGPMHRRFLTRSGLRPTFRRFVQIVRVGGPAALHFMFDVGSWAVFVLFLVGRFGDDQLAASNIVGQYIALCWVPTIGLNLALTQLMGQWIGRGRPDIAKRRVYTALRIGMTYMGTMGILLFLFRRNLVGLFRPEPEVIAWGMRIMVWAAVFQIFDAMGIVFYGGLKGAGDTLLPALAVIGSAYIVFLPLGLLFSVKLGLQAPGAWMAAAVHIFLIAMLLLWRFRSERWLRLRLVQPAPMPALLAPSVPEAEVKA